MQKNDIIKAIEDHAARFNLKVTTIGQLSVKNRNLYHKIKNGSDIQIGTAERVLDWIKEDADTRTKSRAAAE